jgi:hypothetical protein
LLGVIEHLSELRVSFDCLHETLRCAISALWKLNALDVVGLQVLGSEEGFTDPAITGWSHVQVELPITCNVAVPPATATSIAVAATIVRLLLLS